MSGDCVSPFHRLGIFESQSSDGGLLKAALFSIEAISVNPELRLGATGA
jgi:hypothetical protein